MTLTATDMFCGAGGSSVGAAFAGISLRLGLNHWQRAVETHAANFPDADHDCEDIASLTTAQIRRYPDSDILLASPECTNHSLAKGARRRKPQASSLFDDGPAGSDEQDRSRATMWDVVRFAEQKLLKGKPYRAAVVENVVDACRWGYADDGGLFRAWLMAMEALGYRYEIVWLNIRRRIMARAGNRCECQGECGRGTHDGRCPNLHGEAAYGTGSKVVLTTAHLDHNARAGDHSEANLKSMCQGCHLHYDANHRRKNELQEVLF